MGVATGDIDKDGYPNQLWINQGDDAPGTIAFHGE
jgi:hypothetical protein